MDDLRADAAPVGAKEHYHRFNVAVRRSRNWFELLRFCVVGGLGYLVNLAVFVLADRRLPYPVAFVIAFVVAASSNFALNRAWTFRVKHGVPHRQYARFLTVSAFALGFDLLVLTVLVELVGVSETPAAAAAILLATPISFLGNKFWSFR